MTSGNRAGWSYGIAVRGGVLTLGFTAAMALGFSASASAQEAVAPSVARQSSVFDGGYVGKATIDGKKGIRECVLSHTYPINMIIASGQVMVHLSYGGGHTYSGTVNPSGEIWAEAISSDGFLRGNIKGGSFTGGIDEEQKITCHEFYIFPTTCTLSCDFGVSMTKQQ